MCESIHYWPPCGLPWCTVDSICPDLDLFIHIVPATLHKLAVSKHILSMRHWVGRLSINTAHRRNIAWASCSQRYLTDVISLSVMSYTSIVSSRRCLPLPLCVYCHMHCHPTVIINDPPPTWPQPQTYQIGVKINCRIYNFTICIPVYFCASFE